MAQASRLVLCVPLAPSGNNCLLLWVAIQGKWLHCANPKTVNTRITSGMLLCCKEKNNRTQDEKTASCNGN